MILCFPLNILQTFYSLSTILVAGIPRWGELFHAVLSPPYQSFLQVCSARADRLVTPSNPPPGAARRPGPEYCTDTSPDCSPNDFLSHGQATWCHEPLGRAGQAHPRAIQGLLSHLRGPMERNQLCNPCFPGPCLSSGRAGCRLRADPDFHMGDCHPGPTCRRANPLGQRHPWMTHLRMSSLQRDPAYTVQPHQCHHDMKMQIPI